MPAGSRRHLVGRLLEMFVTLLSLKTRFVGRLMTMWTFLGVKNNNNNNNNTNNYDNVYGAIIMTKVTMTKVIARFTRFI